MPKKMSSHDKKVSKVAGGLRSHGWKVKADLPGQPKPAKIGKRRPDVVAKKGSKIRVIEVETPKSAKGAHAREQRRTFRKWAAGGKNRSFKQTKTKK